MADVDVVVPNTTITEHPEMRAALRREVRDLLPGVWPAWFTARRVGFFIVALTATLSTAYLTSWVPTHGVLWKELLLIALGGVMATFATRYAFNAATPTRAIWRSIGGGAGH